MTGKKWDHEKNMTPERLKWICSGLYYVRLSKWESDFVESVEQYFYNNGFLTEKQASRLEDLYREKGR